MNRPELVPIPQQSSTEKTLSSGVVLPVLVDDVEEATLPDEVEAFADLVYAAPLVALTSVVGYYDEEKPRPTELPGGAGAIIGAIERIVAKRADAQVNFDPATEAALKADPTHRKLIKGRQHVRTERDKSSGHALSQGNTRGTSRQQESRDQNLGTRIAYNRMWVFIEQVALWQREKATVQS